MTAPSIVCPQCGEDVPFGRRTCEACGANVTGAAPLTESESGDQPSDDEPISERTFDVAAAGATDDPGWDVPAAAAPFEPSAPTADEAASEAAAPSGAPFVPPVLREWNPGSPLPEAGFAAELAVAEAEPADLAGAWLPPSAGPRDAVPESPSPAPEWPTAPMTPTYAPPASDVPPQAQSVPPPGAMPATLASMLSRNASGTPRWPSSDGGALEPDAATSAADARDGSMTPPSRMPDLGRSMASAAASSPERRPLEPGRAPLFADLPFDAPETLPGWLVAGGGAIATVSFLLPWVAVIDSYFGAWGLGAISNLPAFLVVFGTTALAILPSRLADWLRHGILGLVVGSFILGITWNRLVGATGSQLGVILEATGALLLVIGGILAIVRDRGTADGPAEHR